ncbi:Vacuolar protein sorting-associated protein 41 [Phlyctochytrium bullatum]|nr:Vacuolar protein sorting-associated protein 41 [Phlyctochytrium bullatum]
MEDPRRATTGESDRTLDESEVKAVDIHMDELPDDESNADMIGTRLSVKDTDADPQSKERGLDEGGVKDEADGGIRLDDVNSNEVGNGRIVPVDAEQNGWNAEDSEESEESGEEEEEEDDEDEEEDEDENFGRDPKEGRCQYDGINLSKGVKIYDISVQQKFAYIDRPSDDTLFIGWADSVKVGVVKDRPKIDVASGLPARYVEIVCHGIAPLDDYIVLLSYMIDLDEHRNVDVLQPTSNPNQLSSPPEIHIVDFEGDFIANDVLSLFGYEHYRANDYRLEYLPALNPSERTFYIVSPKDIVVAKPRDLDDHIEWLVERARYEEALQAAEGAKAKGYSGRLTVAQVVEIGVKYLESLISDGKFQLAASTTTNILRQDSRLWEEWIFTFSEANHLHDIIPFIPVKNPVLSSAVYEMVLGRLLENDHETFLSLIKKWPNSLYTVKTVADAVGRVLKQSGDNKFLLEAAVDLYSADRRQEGILSLVPSYNLFSTIDAHLMLYFDYVSEVTKEKNPADFELREYGWRENEVVNQAVLQVRKEGVSEGIKLLVDNTDRIPVSHVVKTLNESSKGSARRYLHVYLDALFRKDRNESTAYQSEQISLYAEFDSSRLLDFLRQSTAYQLGEAFTICEELDLVPEMVYLLGKMGNNRRALALAIEFAKDQNDEGLWEDLLVYSMDKPPFIVGLLENLGSYIEPVNLIRRIPNGLEIPGLRDALVKVLTDYGIQCEEEITCSIYPTEQLVFFFCNHKCHLSCLEASSAAKSKGTVVVNQEPNTKEVKDSVAAAGDMFQKGREALNRAEEISRLSATKDLNLAVSRSSEVATQGDDLKASDFRGEPPLPSLPLSPLSMALQYATRDYQQYREQYAVASATSGSNQGDLSRLRRLLEDVRIAETRVKTIQAAIQNAITADWHGAPTSTTVLDDNQAHIPVSFSARGWATWSAEGIARQIAATNIRLFLRLPIGNKNLTIDCWDRSSADQSLEGAYLSRTIKPCLDFARYLERVVLSSILTATEVVQGRGSPQSPRRNEFVAGPPSVDTLRSQAAALARSQVIQAVISVAYILVHSYRDLNGAVALLRGLLDYRIVRLKRSWEALSPNCRETFRRLEEMLFGRQIGLDIKPPRERVKYIDSASAEVIGLVAELLDHHYVGAGITTVIPYLPPFLVELEELKRSYTVATTESTLSPANLGSLAKPRATVLSDIGQKALGEIMTLLEKCRGHERWNDGGGHTASVSLSSTAPLSDAWSSLSTLGTSGVGQPDSGPHAHPPWERPLAARLNDLSQVGPGDRRILHWLLTRVYRSERELWALAFACEPKAPPEGDVGYVPPPPPKKEETIEAAPGDGAKASSASESTDENKEESTTQVTQEKPIPGIPGDLEEAVEEATDPSKLDALLSSAREELEAAQKLLSTENPQDPSNASAGGSMMSKLTQLFGGRGASSAKGPSKKKPKDEKDDDEWSEDEEDDDDDDGDEKSVPHEVLVAALTAGLAGRDADQVGPDSWAAAAFSSGDAVPDEGDSEDDSELQRRMEALTAALPAVPTSPLKDLDVDEDTASSDAGPSNGAVKTEEPKKNADDAPTDAVPGGSLAPGKEDGADRPSTYVAATTAAIQAATDLDESEFVTPIEISADDELSKASDNAMPNITPEPLGPLDGATPAVIPFGGFASPLGTGFPVSPTAPPPQHNDDDDDDDDDEGGISHVPKEVLLAALHAGIAGEREPRTEIMDIEDPDAAADRLEALLQRPSQMPAPEKEEEGEGGDMMSSLAKRLQGLRSSSSSLNGGQ